MRFSTPSLRASSSICRAAAIGTLKFVASLPPGTEIVFDYAISPSALSERDRTRHEQVARQVAERGEPWLTYFEPPTLAGDLRGIGFTRVEDLGPDGRTAFASTGAPAC